VSESRTYKVAVARFPGDGTERKETVGWLIKTVCEMSRDPRISDIHSICIASTPIYASRNKAVLEAREAGCQYALFLDSDMAPDIPLPGAKPFWATAFDFMVARREAEATADPDDLKPGGRLAPATIAAPYCGPPPNELCYVFHWSSQESDTPNPNFRLEMIPREMAAMKAGIEEVAALPTGLILYDMRVFDVLPVPWFDYEWTDATKSERASTEDVFQTRNASLLGLPQYAAWSCFSGHMKMKLVGRPTIVTRDQVHTSLAEAVLRGLDSDDRLVTLEAKG
jgi:hypothetical protein